MKRKSPIALLVPLAGLLLLFVVRDSAGFLIARRLLFGWARYVTHVLPRLTVSWDGVATGLVCLGLFTLGLHAFLRWFERETRRQTDAPAQTNRSWPFRRTVSLVVVVVVMFVAGIAATGVVHQAGWLLRSKDRWIQEVAFPRDDDYHAISSSGGIKGLSLRVWEYVASRDQLPPTQYDRRGHALHSWQTLLLPFQVVGARTFGLIDLERPWDDPRNAAHFRGIVPDYLNPEIEPIRNTQGYALSHYAGNRHVLGSRTPLRWKLPSLGGPSQGAANTIVAGEVADGFKPWGDPTNLRDPVLGIKGTAETFGNPSRTGANFVFGDGSVRFLSRTTDPKVLGKLSVPSTDPSGVPNASSRAALPAAR